MNTLKTLLLLVTIPMCLEIAFRPRLDWTREKHLILWYGVGDRKPLRIL